MSTSTELRIGVAVGDLNPPDPELLKPTGMGRLVPTRGVLDDLRVEAMAIAAGEELAIILTSDLRTLEPHWVVEAREAVAERTGCDPTRVLFSSVHNHCSSPGAADDSPEASEALERANRKIVDAMITTATNAVEAMAAAEIAAASTELTETIGQNRRMRLDNGTCINCWGSGPVIPPGRRPVAPAGPDAVRVDILAARHIGETKPAAVFTSYGSHPHLYQLPYFSGEFPGAAKRAIEKQLPGAVCLYATNAGGDMDLHCVHPMPDDDEAQVRWFIVSAAVLGERFASAAVPAIPTDGYAADGAMRHEYFEEGPIILNVLAVGDIAFVSMPGELFHCFGQRLLAESPFAHTMIMAYNGSTPGYTPPALAFEQGSYEVMRGPGATVTVEGVEHIRADEQTGEFITGKILEMLRRLHKQ